MRTTQRPARCSYAFPLLSLVWSVSGSAFPLSTAAGAAFAPPAPTASPDCLPTPPAPNAEPAGEIVAASNPLSSSGGADHFRAARPRSADGDATTGVCRRLRPSSHDLEPATGARVEL